VPDDWNEDIMVCELSDEPALGEGLAAVIDRAEANAPATTDLTCSYLSLVRRNCGGRPNQPELDAYQF
jgi:hypothetical protein